MYYKHTIHKNSEEIAPASTFWIMSRCRDAQITDEMHVSANEMEVYVDFRGRLSFSQGNKGAPRHLLMLICKWTKKGQK